MEEGDLLVLMVTVGVSFAFPPLLNKSNRGSFFFIMLCSFIFVDSCVSQFLSSFIVVFL